MASESPGSAFAISKDDFVDEIGDAVPFCDPSVPQDASKNAADVSMETVTAYFPESMGIWNISA